MGKRKVVLGVNEGGLVDRITPRMVAEQERALVHDGESRKKDKRDK
jgi:hypothetical protein